jgi:hypothetical protein
MIETTKKRLVLLLSLLVALVVPGLLPQSTHGMYDPKHGRWLQRDPAGYVDGTSLYQYVGSAPLVVTDPEGLAGCTPSPPLPPCQCCCAMGLKGPLRTKVVNSTVGMMYTQGHEFDIEARLTYRNIPGAAGVSFDCPVSYWEWGDENMIGGDTEKTWINQWTNRPGSDTFKDLQRHLSQRAMNPNPYLTTINTVTIHDPAVVRLKRPFKRNLYIGVKIADAPKCPCPKGSGTFKLILNQRLDAPGTPSLTTLQSFPSGQPGNPPGW